MQNSIGWTGATGIAPNFDVAEEGWFFYKIESRLGEEGSLDNVLIFLFSVENTVQIGIIKIASKGMDLQNWEKQDN